MFLFTTGLTASFAYVSVCVLRWLMQQNIYFIFFSLRSIKNITNNPAGWFQHLGKSIKHYITSVSLSDLKAGWALEALTPFSAASVCTISSASSARYLQPCSKCLLEYGKIIAAFLFRSRGLWRTIIRKGWDSHKETFLTSNAY